MEKTSKRGKIPQSDWPLIMARYDAGETLASIAKTYDCSPPAISYVVSRSRTRQSDIEAPVKAPVSAESHLIKAAVAEAVPASAPTPMLSSAIHRPDDSPRPIDSDGAGPHPPIQHVAAVGPDSRQMDLLPSAGNGISRDAGGEHNINSPEIAALRIVPPPPRLPIPPASAGSSNGDQRRTL